MSEKESPALVREYEWSLFDLLVLIASAKSLVLGIPALVAVIALGVSLFLLPKWYESTARLLPLQQSQSTALAVLSHLGAFGGAAGQAMGFRNSSDTYVALLKSRTVADRLITRFDLQRRYGEDLLYYARKELARNTTISATRDGVITVSVQDKDPKIAAAIANAYIEELRALTTDLAIGEASQRRAFFEAQLAKAKNDLVRAETELVSYSQRAGVVNPTSQVMLTFSAAASMRAQIAAREIQLASMNSFATQSNPEVARVQQEIAGLKAELAKLEQAATANEKLFVPVGKAAELSVEYIRRFRDAKYYETLFEILAKQYELAKMDEGRDAALIQVYDIAIPSDKTSRPAVGLIVVLSAIAALILTVIFVFCVDAMRRLRNDPCKAVQLTRLLDALRGQATR